MTAVKGFTNGLSSSASHDDVITESVTNQKFSPISGFSDQKKIVLPHWSSVRDIERSGPGLLY